MIDSVLIKYVMMFGKLCEEKNSNDNPTGLFSLAAWIENLTHTALQPGNKRKTDRWREKKHISPFRHFISVDMNVVKNET